MHPYAAETDLLVGDVAIPATVSREKFLRDASAEADSYIGRRYLVPLNLDDTDPVSGMPNPIPLYFRSEVKRIVAHLASGRLILAMAAGGEDYQLQAYGRSLVTGALTALQAIADGTVVIPGASLSEHYSETPRGPVWSSGADAESGVDAFYDFTGDRTMPYPYGGGFRPGGA